MHKSTNILFMVVFAVSILLLGCETNKFSGEYSTRAADKANQPLDDGFGMNDEEKVSFSDKVNEGDGIPVDDSYVKDDDDSVKEDDKSDKEDDTSDKEDDEKPVKDPGICKWFDPANPNFAEVISGGPAGLAIPIKRYNASGWLEGENFIFNFTTYGPLYADGNAALQNAYNNTYKILTGRGPEPYLDAPEKSSVARSETSYSVVISKANSAECKAVALASPPRNLRNENNGCFAASTKILMADGSQKYIVHVAKGDMVYNPILKKTQKITEVVMGPEKDRPLYKVGYGKTSVSVTEGHPFETLMGLKKAKDLTLEDNILGADSRYHKISTLETLAVNKNQQVVNITVEAKSSAVEEHLIVADGILTGDLFLQRKLMEKSISGGWAGK